jgi:hypothetical protein
MEAGFAGSVGERHGAVAWLRGGRRWLLLVVCLGLALLAAQVGAPAASAAPTVYPSADQNCQGTLASLCVARSDGFVMSSVAVHLIFWLPSGYHFDPGNPTAAGDQAYESGFEQFYRDLSGSEYANVVSQYYGDPSSGFSASIDGADPSYYPSTISVDAITDPTPFPGAGGITSSCLAAEGHLGYSFLCDSEVQDEIVSDINASTDGWTLHNAADPAAYHDIWMVILPAGIEAGTDEIPTDDTTTFGGYHDYLCTLNGEVDDSDCSAPGAQFGVYSVSTDGGINDQPPLASTSTANGDGWLDWAIADASHELFESITDPVTGMGWITTNLSQDEIADVCEDYPDWPGEAGGYDVVLNGHEYMVSPLLSNAQDALVSSNQVPCSLGFDGQYIDFGLELGNGPVQNGGSVQYGIAPFTVAASATSGLPVTFQAAGGACSVGDVQTATPQTTAQGTNITGTSAQVTLTGTGTCKITASQPGNQGSGGFYDAAAPVTQSFTVTPGTAATPCSPGSYSTTGNAPCTAADAGNFVSGTGATAETPCLAGSYQPNTGQSSCVSADAGSFVANAGSTAETPCLAGNYQPNTGQSSCLSADAGSFVANAGSTAETACLAGTYQPKTGQSSCVSADAGNFVANAGSASESQCLAGTYQPKTGQSSCVSADVGNFVANAGSASESQCLAGTYQPKTGQTSCLSADVGNFVANAGSASESKCLAGTYQSQTGQSSCLSADAGNFVANAGSASESKCLAGTYQSQTGQSSCLSADVGNFVANAGSASESKCLAGTYQPKTGQTSCLAAANDYYVASAGQASETACPVGTSNTGTGNTSCTASTSLSYTGPGQVAISSSFTPAATLSSPVSACGSSQPVNFSVSPDPLTPGVSSSSLSLGTPSTNASGAVGLAGVNTSGWASGVYTITVTYAGTTACDGSMSTAPLAVTAPGQFALGFGSYTPTASLGSTSFGFVVSQTKKGTATTYTGQLGLVTPGKWLFQANVTSFGLTSSTQGLLGGTGSLYWWNSSLNKGRGGWQLAASGVAYKATANAATKTTPASFGITITYKPVSPQPSSLPNSSPVTLAKGIITIS